LTAPCAAVYYDTCPSAHKPVGRHLNNWIAEGKEAGKRNSDKEKRP
jgi:hypothetical protein